MKWGNLFDIAGLITKADKLLDSSFVEGFWNDVENAQSVLRQEKELRKKAASFQNVEKSYEDALVLIELALEEGGAALDDLLPDIKEAFNSFVSSFEALHTSTLLSGEYDKNSAILSLHAGAGGTEACDWVNMLLRMYTRWADSKGYDTQILDYLSGDEAGVKSVTMEVNGDSAYGYLKSEKGIHRLIRLSPFDTAGKRHTSFASCDIMPQLEDDGVIEINPDELRIDTYRSSGAGGQHVNTTDSAIRITHIPTGIITQCQNERSQHKNKDVAMKMLRAKLLELKAAEKTEMLSEVRGEVKDIGWSNQIRSYIFHPYNLVKDHRTATEIGNVHGVMDGNIDGFINAYLLWATGLSNNDKDSDSHVKSNNDKGNNDKSSHNHKKP